MYQSLVASIQFSFLYRVDMFCLLKLMKVCFPFVLLNLCINKIHLNIVLFVLYYCLPVIIRVQLISLVAQKKRPALYEHVQSSGLLVDGKRRV
jgi:hypothetical protein